MWMRLCSTFLSIQLARSNPDSTVLMSQSTSCAVSMSAAHTEIRLMRTPTVAGERWWFQSYTRPPRQSISDSIRIQIPQDWSTEAVIITDPELACPKHRRHNACEEVVEYVHNGGRAIMAGYWSSYIKPADINTWFGEIWGLPWQNGGYSRQTVNLNLHSCT